MLGQVFLGKYHVTRLLDQGGLCKIWLATQREEPREVVVKVLQEPFAGQARPREFLRREIHILARFQHPHAVGYYDSLANDPRGPILVLEYLRGVDLCTLLHRGGPLPPLRAGRLLAQLCDVLGAAHRNGIVHRDVKPGNLMIVHPGTPQETLKLMDFGLAKMAALLYIDADDVADWSSLAASGTPEYIAPEQARGQDIDARGDLYSVGVVLYETLTGRRPFEHGSAEQLLHAHLHENPPSFAARGITTIPPALEAVVQACLAKQPEQRPADAAELLQRYEDALGKRISSPGTSSRVVAVRPSLSGSVPRLPKELPASARFALRQDFEADMPEALALLKVKGFLHDLGSDNIESEPGLIRVRLGEADKARKKSGIFALLDRGASRSAPAVSAPSTEMELHLKRPDPEQPNRLHVTLIMRPSNGLATAEWRSHCQKIGLDLKAYLMGR